MSQDDARELDQEARLEALEYATGLRQKCEAGQHWDSNAGKCVDDPPKPPHLDELLIVAAKASGFDGANVPGNVYDADPDNRFSVKGVGSWIQLDLGAIQEVHQLQFTWFMGANEKREYRVGLEFSELANPPPPSPTSPGAGIEHFNGGNISSIADIATSTKARTICVRLISTSNTGQWLSIRGIKVLGKILDQPPQPPDHTCKQGQHWDDALQQCVDDVKPPEPSPGSSVDVFGIAKIYDDATPPVNNWYFNGVNDPRFMESAPKPTGGGWFTYPSLNQGRIEVTSEQGINEDSFDTFYIDDIIKKGYALKPVNSPDGKGDFGATEVTIRYRNISEGSGSFEAHPEFVYGLFRQTNDTKKVGKDKRVIAQCEAGSYHFNIYKARCKFEKDSKHTEGYTAKDPEAKVGYGNAGKTGFVHKAVIYPVPDSSILGGFAMKLEQYMSTDDGKTFTKILEYLDHGQWGPSRGGHNNECGCSEYVVHNYAHPTWGIRIDFMKSFEFRDWSIRSIDPKKPLGSIAP